MGNLQLLVEGGFCRWGVGPGNEIPAQVIETARQDCHAYQRPCYASRERVAGKDRKPLLKHERDSDSHQDVYERQQKAYLGGTDRDEKTSDQKAEQQ